MDAAGDAYVTGSTDSDKFPLVNPIQDVNQAQAKDPAGGGGTNAFLFELNPAGSQLLYSTYLGGSGGAYTSFDGSSSPDVQGEDYGSGIALDSAGNAYVVGTTNSTDFPTTVNALYLSFGQGGLDAFVTELSIDASGSKIVYSTYYAGSGADASSKLGIDAYDEGNAIAVDQYGTAYITGLTTSADFPTHNAGQSTFGGGILETSALDAADEQYPPDAFVVQISNHNLIVTPRRVNAAIGQTFTQKVATFTAPNPNLPASDYTASINWGDGGTSIGTVSMTGNPAAPYQVNGTHTYTATGDFAVVVTVTDTYDGLQANTGVDASSMPGSQAEPTVTVNPTNTNNLFVASSYGATGIDGFGAYSMNGGASWNLTNGGNIGTGSGAASDGLPVVFGGNFTAAFDQFGNLYLTYIATNQSGQREIAIAWSTDGGETFQPLAEYPGVNADQPKVTTGPGPTAATASVLISFTYGTPFQVYVVGAEVKGFDVAPRLSADPVAVPGGGNNSLTTDVAVGPSGQVAVTWAGFSGDGTYGDVYLNVDPQGLNNLSAGAFQQTPTAVPIDPSLSGAPSLLGTFIAVPAAPYRGISGVQPWIAFDDTNGPNRGRLYLLYSSSNTPLNGSTAIQKTGPGVQNANAVLSVNLIYSTNNGATFSPSSSIVNNSGGDELIPNLAVDPVSGDVAVGFYATSSPTSPVTAFYTTLSDDGGQTFSTPQQVSIGSTNLVTSPVGSNNPLQYVGDSVDQYGDYSGLAFFNGVIYPAWVDNSSQLEGNPDTPNSDIAVVRVVVAPIVKPIPVVTALPVAVNVGQTFSQPVATFTDPGQSTPAQFTVTINWGDGTPFSTVTPTQPGGPGTLFVITGTHTYTSAGAYPIVVTVTDTTFDTSASTIDNASFMRDSQMDGVIAVDPINPALQVVAGVFQFGLASDSGGIYVANSTDEGASWNRSAIGEPYDSFPAAAPGYQADPSATFDQFGNLFLAYWASDRQSLILLESTDGGQTFTLLHDFNLPARKGRRRWGLAAWPLVPAALPRWGAFGSATKTSQMTK